MDNPDSSDDQPPSAFLPKLTRASLTSQDDRNLAHSALLRLERAPALPGGLSTTIDDLERSYITSWLQRFLKLSLDIADDVDDAAGVSDDSAARLGERAADLLRAINNESREDDRVQTYSFEGENGQSVDLSISTSHMRDVDATGFRTWSSSILLATMLCKNLQLAFPRRSMNGDHSSSLRVLELGSGTGLAGLACAKSLLLGYARSYTVEVTLSDYDDTTLITLEKNVGASGLANSFVHVQKLDWNDYSPDQVRVRPYAVGEAPVPPKYNLMLGADIIYETYHAQLVYQTVDALLDSPGIFHLVVPLRHTHERDLDQLEQRFNEQQTGSEFTDGTLKLASKQDFEADPKYGPYGHRYYRITR